MTDVTQGSSGERKRGKRGGGKTGGGETRRGDSGTGPNVSLRCETNPAHSCARARELMRTHIFGVVFQAPRSGPRDGCG
jgi:hypothetical protein